MIPRSVGLARGIHWYFGQMASIAGAVATHSRAPGFNYRRKVRLIDLRARPFSSRHMSCGGFFFSITNREVVI